jgi:hypothetical protein
MGSNPLKTIGSIAGGAIGFSAGGPLGASIGAGLGGALGGSMDEKQDPIKADTNYEIGGIHERNMQINEMLDKYRGAGAQTQNSQFSSPQLASVQNLGQLYNQIGQQGTAVTNQQVQNAQGANLANAYSLAASQPGAMNPALAQRQAMDQIANGNQQILQQSLPAALQEQNQNINQQVGISNAIGQQASQGRQQDLQYEQMKNQLIAQFMSMGFTQEQAQTQARLEAARIQAGIQGQNLAANNQMAGGMLSTIGQVGSSMISSGMFKGSTPSAPTYGGVTMGATPTLTVE